MERIAYIQDLSNYIYENIAHISYGIKDVNSLYRIYTSFAMSKAEYSKLTLKEAIQIQKKEVDTKKDDYFETIKREVEQLSIYKKDYQKELQSLHDKLEYYNISTTLNYIKSSDLAMSIKNKGISDELLLDIHYRLTIGLDDLFYGKLDDYDPYYPGVFRTKDNIKVGTKRVLEAKLVRTHLDEIYNLSKKIEDLDNIFYLHARLYYCHAFSNGNKRVCRVLEEMYIENIGIESTLSASHGYYLQQHLYIQQIYLKTIRKPLFESFSDFGYSSLLLSGLYLIHNELSGVKKEILKQHKLEIFKNFHEGEKLKTKNLEREHRKKTKISERSFYLKLLKEKELLGDMISEEKVGRNIYYYLNIQDPQYLELKAKLFEVLDEYKKYNRTYSEILFLRNY